MDGSDTFFLMQRASELRKLIRDGMQLHRRLINERRSEVQRVRAITADIRSTTERSRERTMQRWPFNVAE